jgi:hypothetical protein
VVVALILLIVLASTLVARTQTRSRSGGGFAGLAIVFCVLAILSVPSFASAQEEPHSSIVWNATKSVLFDPTTYTPALMSYESERMDWNTSQGFFRAGWLEGNSRFTKSGLPNDVPLSYSAGNAQIRRDGLARLQQSVLNNLGASIVERALSTRYPEHRKLFRAASWIERISFASYASYLASADHFKQTRKNRQMAREYGY